MARPKFEYVEPRREVHFTSLKPKFLVYGTMLEFPSGFVVEVYDTSAQLYRPSAGGILLPLQAIGPEDCPNVLMEFAHMYDIANKPDAQVIDITKRLPQRKKS